MKYILLLFATITCPYLVHAQKQGQELIDYLLQELPKAKDDTSKVMLLNNISRNYSLFQKPLKGIEYGEQALSLANTLAWKTGMIRSYSVLGEAYHAKNDYKMAIDYASIGLRLAEEISSIEEQAGFLHNIAMYYGNLEDSSNHMKYRLLSEQLYIKTNNKQALNELYIQIGQFLLLKDMASGIQYFLKALQIKDAIKDTLHYNQLLGNIAEVYLWMNNSDEAEKYYNKLLNYYVAHKDSANTGYTIIKIGDANRLSGKHFPAIEYLFKARKIFQTLGDKYGIARCYNLIGSVYMSLCLYDKAIEYYLKALHTSEQIDNPDLSGAVLNDLTILYEKTGAYDKALEYLLRSKKSFEQIEDKSFLATVCVNMGYIYIRKKEYELAMKSIQEGKLIYLDKKDNTGYAFALMAMGQVYYETKKLPEALQAQYEALNLYTQNGDNYIISILFAQVARSYIQVTLHRNLSMPDSLSRQSNLSLLKKSTDLVNRSIQIAKESNNLELLRDNYNALATAYELMGDFKSALESYKLETMYHDSIFGSEKVKTITSLDLQYDFDKKEAATIAEHEKQLAVTQEANKARLKIVGTVATALIILTAGGFYFFRRKEKDRFQIELMTVKQEALNARMSDHFIGNTMDSINNFIRNNDQEKASEYLILFNRLIRQVLENATERTIPLADDLNILKDYLELEKLRFPPGTFQYDIIMDNSVDPHKMQIPPMVFQTLAENAIKHGFNKSEGGNLIFRIGRAGRAVVCSVEDNGTGRKESLRYKDSAASSRSSLGSSIAERLVKTVSKHSKETSFKVIDLFDDSNNPSGTKVEFTLPYVVAE